ncbi:TPA_asm: hypothetical protein G0D24_11965 [Salmonella enterica subsp. enterica serovar Abortusovis]|nr:hypothetical protein [Salmonella enterica subsp. enterica serovar Abortusovis]
MFNFDHESPSLRHEQIALEEYTVPLHYGCVNIQTSKTRHIRLADALASLLTLVTYFSKLLGMRCVAAFLQAELFRVLLSDSIK